MVVDEVMYAVGKEVARIPSVDKVGGRQHVEFFGDCCEKPAEGNISWVGASPGTQGYYVFALPK